jgi:DNA adenine methylase
MENTNTLSQIAINSPFRYPGGKFYARNSILGLIPQHKCYIEPLAGGASIFFAKEKVAVNVLNDADEDLINCYTHIQGSVEELISLLSGIEVSKEQHDFYKNRYTPQTPLERAFRWYYLNRTSFSGIMNMTNCYWGYGDEYSMKPEKWPDHLRRCSIKLQGVELKCNDFAAVIEQAPQDSFLFVDPPYFSSKQAGLYTHSFTKDDHQRLADILREHRQKIKFLLTYDSCAEIRELYQWTTTVIDQEWNYTLARTDDQKAKSNGSGDGSNGNSNGKRSKGKELFILNYAPSLITSKQKEPEYAEYQPSLAK